jgi:dihydropteroate synthase
MPPPARHVGIDRARIVIDPGIGFGKRGAQDSLIVGKLGQLAALELPIMAGPSRKSFLAHKDPEETRCATAAAVAACILHGAHVVRVHDVKEMRAAADVADDILKSIEEQ